MIVKQCSLEFNSCLSPQEPIALLSEVREEIIIQIFKLSCFHLTLYFTAQTLNRILMTKLPETTRVELFEISIILLVVGLEFFVWPWL